MSVGIINDDFFGNHSTSWAKEWLDVCKSYNIEHELIDWRDEGAFNQALKHDFVIWHFSHYSDSEMKFARSILYALSMRGIKTFPDFNDSWHFDDKIAQSYLLKAISAPTPENRVFYSRENFDKWCKSVPVFPKVVKLRAGSGSHNVNLVHSIEEISKYADKMFGEGLNSTPSVAYKIGSNLKSSKSISDIIKRIKRIPDFIFSLSQAKKLPREKGYVYVQDFIANAKFDLKVVVVGDKLSFIGRRTRENDFRASGGGDLFYDRSVMTKEIINVGFYLADTMKSQCVGMDIVIDPETSKPMIVEISYGFSHTALIAANGYYNRDFVWNETPMNAPEEIMLNLIKK